MDLIVKKFITHPINGESVLNICNGEANLVTNSELASYNSIDDVLGKHGASIILYDKKNGSAGHWACIIKQEKDLIEYFDSYGLSIDEPIHFTGGNAHLSSLIRESKYRVYFNDYMIQKYKDNINTCGRYVGVRILLRNLPLRSFINLFTKNKSYDSDFWCTCMTMFCEN